MPNRGNIINLYFPLRNINIISDKFVLTLILLTTTIVVVCSSAYRFHSRIRVKFGVSVSDSDN